MIGVDGGTESIRACCFDAADGSVIGSACAVPYKTSHPHPGWAEQNPEEWYENLGTAVRGALNSCGNGDDDVRGRVRAVCVDTTCCSVVALDGQGVALRPCLLWMDARSAPQAERILTSCRGDPHLRVNSDGHGPLSAEWLLPKALWIKEHEPELWERAVHVCEYQDYLNYRLTGGTMVASSCNAAARWHWDGEEALQEPTAERPFPGRPLSLYEKLDVPELAHKLPRRCAAMGTKVGTLCDEAARHLGLPPGVDVAQGGPDAFVGMVGLGCVRPGQLCLITGSSHLHCCVVDGTTATPDESYWGPYRGAPLPGTAFVEGGQSSTGSMLRWAKNTLFHMEDTDYAALDQEAAATVPPGCDGLVALETLQGARTPRTDPKARGALVGLTLSHTRAHVWRALCESVCYGTKACVEGLGRDTATGMTMAGGATRSPFWTQMHADVTGLPVTVTRNTDAPLLGCAILASVVAGAHGSVQEAADAMVRVERVVEPDPGLYERYDAVYRNVYRRLAPAVRPVVHAMSDLRGGGGRSTCDTQRTTTMTVSPSLLASDWADVRDGGGHAEVRRRSRY